MNIKSIIRTFSHRVSKTLGVIVLTMTAQTVWAQTTENLGGHTYTIGTDNDGSYYVVDNKEDLDALATYVNAGNNCVDKRFKMTSNITYNHTTDWDDNTSTENNYTAIGTITNSFQGTFDGDNKTISGIRIKSTNQCQGLFGAIDGTAVVKNVTLTDARIAGANYTGSIVGYTHPNALVANSTTVTNCHICADVAIVASNQYYGGIVGYNNRSIVSDCTSAVRIIIAEGKTPSFLGGIVGCNASTIATINATLTDNLVVGAVIPAAKYNLHAAIAVDDKTNSRYHVHYERNYYYGCTIGDTFNVLNKGIATFGNSSSTSVSDVNTTDNPDGAVGKSVYTLTLADGITAVTTLAFTVSGTPYYLAGTTITLSGKQSTPEPPVGSIYGDGYTVTKDGTSPVETVEVTETSGVYTFQMPASNVTVNSTWTAIPWDGMGTVGNPYIIQYASQLDLLAQRVNSGTDYSDTYFKLANDITYTHTTAWNDAMSSENNYTSIGCFFDSGYRYFRGNFDGNNKIVSGIRIYQGSEYNQGLFGAICTGAEVKDVTLTDARIIGKGGTGCIVGYNTGCTVSGCHVAADVNLHVVQSNAQSFGGIVGNNVNGIVSGCTSAVKITAKSGISNMSRFGGIVGINGVNGKVEDSRAIGVILPAVNYAGAIVGRDDNNNTTLSGNTYHSCLVGTNAFNIGAGDRDDVSGDMTGATLDNTALYLDDYMDASALIAAYADPASHTAYNGVAPNVSNLTATLSRTFPAGKKQTVCLPFPPTALYDLGTVWEFTGISADGKAVMTQRIESIDGDLTANTPYIFEATNEVKNPTFSGVEVSNDDDPKTTDATAGFTFHGTYEQKHWLATSDEVTQGTIYGFMAEDNDGQTTGQFVRARRETYLRPFSCYLEYDGELTGTQTATARRMTRADIETLPDVIDIVWQPAGSTTGISDASHLMDNGQWIMDNKAGAGWYSLDGRRLNGRPTAKGIYVRGGKKFIIK